MASRDSIKHTVSISAPTIASIGDEWVSPSAPSVLYKRTIANGSVGWVPTSLGISSGGGGITITDDVVTNASYYPIVATTAGGSTAKTASTKLAFNPSTGSLSATNFTSLSDKNFKSNIATITPSKGLEVVNSLNAVSFNWKDNDDKAYGIIAQEIEEILPEIVTTDEFGIKKVAYNQIIPFLLSAVKALSKEVNALKGR